MKNKGIFILIIFWFLIIFGFTIDQELIIQNGGEVLLKVRPYDPRDLIRGDYVNLTYDISLIPKEKNRHIRGGDIYIVLEKDKNNIAAYKKYQFKKPKEGLYIKGKNKDDYRHDKLNVKYGIESYFIKQNTGSEIEKRLAKGGLARVKISKSGRAKIVELIY